MIPRSVLVIDDEEDMRELATFALELNGEFVVATASSGEDGIESARRSPPAVILLDWMMPGKSGSETLRALKSDDSTSGIPVIILSGAVHDRTSAEFVTLGALGALAKPFNPMTLAAELAALLGEPGAPAV